MPRIPRSFTVCSNLSVHKIWRGHNKEWNLKTEADKSKYLALLNEDVESEKFQSASQLHALTLMSNHTHEVVMVLDPKRYSNHMRRHHSRYGMYFNQLNDRCGKVAQDRPKTCLIADEHHEMRTIFYIHANPIRANIVKDARHYRWSTHKLYAFGKRELWMKHVRFPAWYLRLGKTSLARQKKYRRLFARYLKEQGRTKQPFLRKLFFGPDIWMEMRQESVSQWFSLHAGP